MSDLPKYERRNQITPAAQPTGFSNSGTNKNALNMQHLNSAGEGLKQVGNAFINAQQTTADKGRVWEQIGQFSNQLAQNAANQRAREEGIKAAQDPTRQIYPEFTQTGAEFANAFKQEQSANINFHGERLINQLANSVKRNLNAQSLDEFQNQAETGLNELVSQSSSDMAPQIKRNLISNYESTFAQLSGALYEKEQAYKRSQNNVMYESGKKTQQNLALQGDFGAAGQKLIDNLNFIANLESNGEITPEQAYARSEEIHKQLDVNRAQKEWLDNHNISEESGAKFIRDLVESNDLDPDTKEAVVSGVLQYRSNYRAAQNVQQTIEYSNANLDLAEGRMTPERLDYYSEIGRLSHHDITQLKLSLAKNAAKDYQKTELVQDISKISHDAVEMSKVSKEDKNTYFKYMVETDRLNVESKGGEYSQPILRQARLASTINSPISVFQGQLESAIQFGTPEQLEEAGKAIQMLTNVNKNALDGLDKNARSASSLYNHYRLDTQREDPASLARNAVYNVDEATKKTRAEQATTYMRQKDYNDPGVVKQHLASALGAKNWFSKNSVFPDALVAKYQAALPSYIERSGNEKIADQELTSDLAQVYKPTNINNRNELMPYPPESVLEPAGYWVENDRVRAFQQMSEANTLMAKNKEFILNRVEFEPLDLSDLISKPLVNGSLKAKVDGVERKIVIKSDDLTKLPGTRGPSWSFWFLDDNNIEQPIMDSRYSNGPARWYPDYQLKEEQLAKYRDWQYVEAKKILDEAAKARANSSSLGNLLSNNPSEGW